MKRLGFFFFEKDASVLRVTNDSDVAAKQKLEVDIVGLHMGRNYRAQGRETSARGGEWACIVTVVQYTRNLDMRRE